MGDTKVPKRVKIGERWYDARENMAREFELSHFQVEYIAKRTESPGLYRVYHASPSVSGYDSVGAFNIGTGSCQGMVLGVEAVSKSRNDSAGYSSGSSSANKPSESANSGQEAEGVWGCILGVIGFVRFLFSPLYKMRYFKEPAARAEWWLTVLGVVVRFFIVGVIMDFGGAQDDSYLILLAVALLPLVVISLRRVRDAGKPWWWVFVPAANVILCGFFPSGAGETGAVNAMERGASHVEKGLWDKAISDFTQAIRQTSDNEIVQLGYFWRGKAHYGKDDYDSAIADFTQSLRLKNDDALSYKFRADVYYDMEKYDLAIADLDQLIRLEGENAEAYLGRGILYFLKNEHDRAITDYDQAIRLNPKSALAYSKRGLCYAEKGDLDRAIEDFDQIIRLDPKGSDGAWAYAKRGLAYADKGDFDRTISDFETVLRLNPNDEEAAAILERARQMKKGQG